MIPTWTLGVVNDGPIITMMILYQISTHSLKNTIGEEYGGESRICTFDIKWSAFVLNYL